MSPTYSRNSRPCIKNIVISLFSTVFGSVCRMLRFRRGGGAWWVRRRGGTGRVCLGGWMEDGEAPRWQTVRVSASCSDSELSLVDVEVSEVVEGCPQGPAGLHVVHLLGQLWVRQEGVNAAPRQTPSSPHVNVYPTGSDMLTCSTVLSLKPKPSFSRQVM